MRVRPLRALSFVGLLSVLAVVGGTSFAQAWVNEGWGWAAWGDEPASFCTTAPSNCINKCIGAGGVVAYDCSVDPNTNTSSGYCQCWGD